MDHDEIVENAKNRAMFHVEDAEGEVVCVATSTTDEEYEFFIEDYMGMLSDPSNPVEYVFVFTYDHGYTRPRDVVYTE